MRPDRLDARAILGPVELQRHPGRLRHWVGSRLADRLSPERTRRATLLERMTVRRLSWDLLVRANRWLGFLGKLATTIWVATIASIVLGFDVRDAVQGALNSGRRLEHAVALAVLVPTLIFLLARSMLGFARWRLQRELWRRDVERLTAELERRVAA
jgi:hypothetical protein